MTNRIAIRATTKDDLEQVLALYPKAFPEEELRPVVSALLEEGSDVLSLAGFDNETLVSHALFTICGTEARCRAGALLGPLAVVPSLHRLGLGSALVHAGLERLEGMGIDQVFVLGDPAYYQRFGFSLERQVSTPYPLPKEWADAWQSMLLGSGEPIAEGRLLLPKPWMEPALWGP